jgi:carbonic anhydrase
MALASRLLTLLAAAAAIGFATAQKTPDEALRALCEGNQRFAADRSLAQPLGEGVRRTLARGQSPFAVVLCCADSRVPPEHVFNTGLGELFVVRVAGHCADEETIASIEYAVEHLGASLCVVLGHEQCDAVAAAAAQVDQPGHDGEHGRVVQQLFEHIEPAVRKAKARDLGGKSLLDACEEEHAQSTVQDCMRRSALLRRYAGVGKFRMVAARYHLQSGEVEWLPNRPLPAEERTEDTVHVQPPAGVPPHVALRMLQAGHRRFLGDGKATADLGAARREALTHGQQPLAIVLTCADSRVAPEHVFDSGLGEMLVVRIAGNVLNDDALASVEFAASELGASLLVVMGHSKCGAVQAAAQKPEGQELSPNLRALLLRLEPSVQKARAEAKGRDVVDLAVRGNALRAVHEARSRSAVLRRLEDDGRFAMLACVYDIASGDIEWLKDTADAPPHAEPETTPAATQAPAPTAAPAAPHEEPPPTMVSPEPPAHDPGNAAPAGETKPQTAPAPAPHAAPAAGHGHDAPPSHESPAHEPAARETAAQVNAARGPTPFSPSRDPIVVAGALGVLSLLIAALLATRRR